MDVAVDVDARLRTEQQPGRIDQEQAGAGDGRKHPAVDPAGAAAGDSRDQVVDRADGAEAGRFGRAQGELGEAVEQVAAAQFAHGLVDHVVGADRLDAGPWSDAAVTHDLGAGGAGDGGEKQGCGQPLAAQAVHRSSLGGHS